MGAVSVIPKNSRTSPGTGRSCDSEGEGSESIKPPTCQLINNFSLIRHRRVYSPNSTVQLEFEVSPNGPQCSRRRDHSTLGFWRW